MDLQDNIINTNNQNQQLNDNKYKGTTILTEAFEYRLGLDQFDFEHGYASVEYELEGLNFHYIDPNDVMDTAFNHNMHQHQRQSIHQHHFYESDISEDSDDEKERKRIIHSKQKKKKRKKREKKKFDLKENKMGKWVEGLKKEIGDKIEDIKQAKKAKKRKHGPHDSVELTPKVMDEKVQSFDITPSLPRQVSTPGHTTSDWRKKMEQAGSLTDGDEPMHDHLTVNHKNKTSELMHTNSAILINNHRRRRSSSSQSSVFDVAGAVSNNVNKNNIIEEEDADYYDSD